MTSNSHNDNQDTTCSDEEQTAAAEDVHPVNPMPVPEISDDYNEFAAGVTKYVYNNFGNFVTQIGESNTFSSLMLFGAVPSDDEYLEIDEDAAPAMLYSIQTGYDPTVMRDALFHSFKKQILESDDCSVFIMLRDVVRSVEQYFDIDPEDTIENAKSAKNTYH